MKFWPGRVGNWREGGSAIAKSELRRTTERERERWTRKGMLWRLNLKNNTPPTFFLFRAFFALSSQLLSSLTQWRKRRYGLFINFIFQFTCLNSIHYCICMYDDVDWINYSLFSWPKKLIFLYLIYCIQSNQKNVSSKNIYLRPKNKTFYISSISKHFISIWRFHKI
jgi:hypothetical protein